MPSGSSGSQTTTQTQKSEPWEPQQPYLKDVFGEAARWYYGDNPIYLDSAGQRTSAPASGRAMSAQPSASNQPTQPLWGPAGGPYVYPAGHPLAQQADPFAASSSALTGGARSGQSGSDITKLPDPNALPQFFPGSTVVPFASETERALGMMANEATDPGSHFMQALQRASGIAGGGTDPWSETPWTEGAYSPTGLSADVADATMRGDFLNRGNPVFDQMLEGVSYDVAPRVAQQFGMAGRSGRSPLAQEAFSRGLTQGMLPFLESERSRQVGVSQADLARREAARQATLGREFGAREAGLGRTFAAREGDLGREMQALAMVPAMTQQRLGMLSQAGATREGKARDHLQEQIDRWNFEQNAPLERLKQFAGLVTGNYGGTSTGTVTQPTYSNPLMQGLGGAATVGSLFAPSGGGGALAPLVGKA